MKRLTDPTFRYYPAADTDIKRTFARLKREAEAKKKAEQEHRTVSILRKKTA